MKTTKYFKKIKKLSGHKSPSTVKNLIKQLEMFPPNSFVYIRPKYTGEANWLLDYFCNVNGVSEMESKGLGKHVTILF